MSNELIWPSTERVGDRGSHESRVRDFETESIRKQWEVQKERLFCEDEDEMLVECGFISEQGGFKTTYGKNSRRGLKKTGR